MDGQAECLEDQILADVFGLESGVTTEGSCSFVIFYDHINSIIINMQLLYVCYFAPMGYLVPVYPRYFLSMATI